MPSLVVKLPLKPFQLVYVPPMGIQDSLVESQICLQRKQASQKG